MDTSRFSYWILLILKCKIIHLAIGSDILGIFPIGSKSQIGMHEVLMKNLASRDHRVTVLSFFNGSSSYNYDHIGLGDISKVDSYVDNVTPDDAKLFVGLSFYFNTIRLSKEDKAMCNVVYSHPYVRNIISGYIRSPDLLVIEFFHVPCLCSLAEKFNVPVIYSAASLLQSADYVVGNPLHPAYLPCFSTGYTQTMTFYQRLNSFLHYTVIYSVHHLVTKKLIVEMDETYVGNQDVTVEKLYGRIGLVLLNNHFSFLNRPSVPNSIEIAGMHIQKVKPLPTEIKQFVEEAKHGVIFFSFGTALKFSSIPIEKIEIFKKAFSKIPQRILWRSDVENLTDVPSNIMIRNWFPQRDVLEHENVKAFISHCGIFSSLEAIHTGVPIIGIPFMYDQFANSNILRGKGVAITLDYDNINFDDLLNALKNIIDDDSYYKNMQQLSTIFKDRPMSPLDTATYWVEYILTYKRVPHLRIASTDMPLYKFLLLDIIGLLLICLLTIIWVPYNIHKSIKYGYSRLTLKIKKNR